MRRIMDTTDQEDEYLIIDTPPQDSSGDSAANTDDASVEPPETREDLETTLGLPMVLGLPMPVAAAICFYANIMAKESRHIGVACAAGLLTLVFAASAFSSLLPILGTAWQMPCKNLSFLYQACAEIKIRPCGILIFNLVVVLAWPVGVASILAPAGMAVPLAIVLSLITTPAVMADLFRDYLHALCQDEARVGKAAALDRLGKEVTAPEREQGSKSLSKIYQACPTFSLRWRGVLVLNLFAFLYMPVHLGVPLAIVLVLITILKAAVDRHQDQLRVLDEHRGNSALDRLEKRVTALEKEQGRLENRVAVLEALHR